jgi:hypothetical protein
MRFAGARCGACSARKRIYQRGFLYVTAVVVVLPAASIAAVIALA